MAAQTLIFCVGAAKSGTSWLWDYLAGHPEVFFPAVKELHYFDALEPGGKPWFRNALKKRLEHLTEKDAAGQIGPFQRQFLSDGAVWLDRFDGRQPNHSGYLDFLGLGRADAKAVGDFTPSYALLPAATYRSMSKLAERVRFVFLMRDPVQRLWSNIRMDAGKGADAAMLERELDKVLAGKNRNIARRSNYRRTLRQLLAAVPRENVFIAFYERLFRPETIEALCVFLGLTPQPARFEKVVHAGRLVPLPGDRLGEMVDYLKPQYRFVERLMGGLPKQWSDNMVNA